MNTFTETETLLKTAIILLYVLIVWVRSRGRVGLVGSHAPPRADGGR